MAGSALECISAIAQQQNPSGHLERILWLHQSDRWYFGDFLRHAAWLKSLLQENPHAQLDLASHPEYLSLYDDNRFGQLLNPRNLFIASSDPFETYDLVIAPGPFETGPDQVTDRSLPSARNSLLLRTWDSGWSLSRTEGDVIRGSKTELNYFRAAHPSSDSAALVRPWNASSSLPGWLSPIFTPEETALVDHRLARRFPGDAPVIVYNPTASNAFTRGTDIPKEVGNRLSAREHAVILGRLQSLFPGHLFLVASALKDGDDANAEMISALAHSTDSQRVACLFDLNEPWLQRLRSFASLLASPRVCSSVGSGTGTNTHLSAVLDVPSLSIERGADAEMLANWDSDEFQMGSFRWRNPATCTAVHTLDWSNRSDTVLEEVAVSFLAHHSLHHGGSRSTLFPDLKAVAAPVERFRDCWPEQPLTAMAAAQEILALMHRPARRYYSHFSDEAAYLRFRYGIRSHGLPSVAQAVSNHDGEISRTGLQLFQDSNLHKLVTHLHDVLHPGGDIQGRQSAPLNMMAASA